MNIRIPDNRCFNYRKAVVGTIRGLFIDRIEKAPDKSTVPCLRRQRSLGKTGMRLPLLSMGGQSVVELRTWPRTAERLLHHALDMGICHIDTAPSYGVSQRHIGKFISGRRSEYSLSSKTRARDYDGIMRSIDQSLCQLKTDHIDIFFIHCLETESDFVQLFGGDKPGIDAFLALKQQGVVAFIGASSDVAPYFINRVLDQDILDVIMVPVNPADCHADSFIRQTIPKAKKHRVGIMAMQIFAGGRLMRYTGISPADALRYALSQDVDTAVVSVDSIAQLEANAQTSLLSAAMTESERHQLEHMTIRCYRSINRFKQPPMGNHSP